MILIFAAFAVNTILGGKLLYLTGAAGAAASSFLQIADVASRGQMKTGNQLKRTKI